MTFLLFNVAMLLEGLWSGSRVHFQIWKSAQIWWENHRKNAMYKFLHFFCIFPSLLQDFLLFLYLDLDPQDSPLCHKQYYSYFLSSIFFLLFVDSLPIGSIFQTTLYIWMWALNPAHSPINKVATTATIHIFSKRFPQG